MGTPQPHQHTLTGKARCLAALRGDPVDRVPVFPLLMFLAQDRMAISYRTFASDGHALAEAQLNVHSRFPVDALTVCSDAFRVPADLGASMAYPEDKPPFATQPMIRNSSDISRLGRPDPTRTGSRMADRLRAVRELDRAVGRECLVLGWIDMPFAEACSLCGLTEFMLLIVDEPALAHALLSRVTEIVIDFGVAQILAGAPMIGAGDAAASLVSVEQYREFALPYERRVVEALHAAKGLVKLHICGNTSHLLTDMIRCGADLFNVDHLVSFEAACRVYGQSGLCFKGNLDPVADMLQSSPDSCRQACFQRMHAAAGLRYMLSAGCEIPAATSDDVFMAFCDAPRRFASMAS